MRTDSSVVVVGSGLAGLSCAESLAGLGLDVTVISAGNPGQDGASSRLHALAPWILLAAPWEEGPSVESYFQDLAGAGGEKGRDLEAGAAEGRCPGDSGPQIGAKTPFIGSRFRLSYEAGS